jgi:penicillin-binding protein 2 prime
VELANTGTAYEIGIVPKNVSKKDYKAIAKELSISEDYIKQQMDQNWVQDDTFVPLKTVKKMDQHNLIDVKSLFLEDSYDFLFH